MKVAWRNIWRNKIRSWVVIGSVFIGIWSILFVLSQSYSIVVGYVNDAIRLQTSHFQIHHPKFKEDRELQYVISNPESVIQKVRSMPEVDAASLRTVIGGMVRSSRSARGVTIYGINPEEEAMISTLDQKIIEGNYFNQSRRNEIVISQKLAERLKVKLRKKVVLQFLDVENNIVAGSFRVVGIFKTGNTVLDESFVQVNRNDINRLLGGENYAHEIAVFLKTMDDLEGFGQQIKAEFSDLLVENYREISPDVELYESQIDVSSKIFTVIFMLALIFGIINTMLMTVLERSKELGMLMAVGMNKSKVFLMIVLETLLLGLIALPIGLICAYLTISYFGHVGIDLSAFAQGIEQFGMSTILYPELPLEKYTEMSMSVMITALLASIYPAIKAVRLKPVEALQKI